MAFVVIVGVGGWWWAVATFPFFIYIFVCILLFVIIYFDFMRFFVLNKWNALLKKLLLQAGRGRQG